MRAQRGGRWRQGSDFGYLANGCLADRASPGRTSVQQCVRRQERGGRSSGVVHVSSMCEALPSVPSTSKPKNLPNRWKRTTCKSLQNMVAHVCNPSTLEAEAEELLHVSGQLGCIATWSLERQTLPSLAWLGEEKAVCNRKPEFVTG